MDFERVYADVCDRLDAEGLRYSKFHLRRYRHAIKTVAHVIEGMPGRSPLRILDIGPSMQTLLLAGVFPDASVNTLGFLGPRYAALRGTHFEFDLNDAGELALEPPPITHEIVVMGELLEHLYTAPSLVLRFLAGLLSGEGALVLQTPNPVSLKRRFDMLMGRSPFEMIRENRRIPGHFCEYTAKDLEAVATRAGFRIADLSYHNYFGEPGGSRAFYDFTCRRLPGSFREGITAVLRPTL